MLGHLTPCVPPGMESGPALFSYVIFQGAINFKFNPGGLLLESNNVNNPRALGDVLAPDCGEISNFLFGVEGKASCLRIKREPELGRSRRGAVSRASGLKRWRTRCCWHPRVEEGSGIEGRDQMGTRRYLRFIYKHINSLVPLEGWEGRIYSRLLSLTYRRPSSAHVFTWSSLCTCLCPRLFQQFAYRIRVHPNDFISIELPL